MRILAVMQLKHGDMAWRGRETGGGRQGGIFCLLHTISYFTYEMVDKQGKIAMEGDFRKRRAGCPLFRSRPV